MTRHQLAERFLVAMLVLTPVGCAAINRVTPVERPPVEYQHSRPILVEFVSPEAVMARCFERGSLVPAMACADTDKITISNPCATDESFSRTLCHELAHVNGWKK